MTFSVERPNGGGNGYSALARLSQTHLNQSVEFTAAQAQMDGAVTHVLAEAGNTSTMAALLMGGGAARLTRTGILAFGANATGWGARAVQVAAATGSLMSEVVAFEGTSRALDHSYNPNRWRWDGVGGLRQGFFTSGITFTALRGAGWAAQGQNIVFQHAAQSTAMVAGHNIAGALRIIPAPEGSLMHQFFEAEMTNIELAATMGALHAAAPGIHAFERSLDLANQSRISLFRERSSGGRIAPERGLVAEGVGELHETGEDLPTRAGLVFMARPRGPKRGRRRAIEREMQGTQRPAATRARVREVIEATTKRLEELSTRYERIILGLMELSRSQPENKSLDTLINRSLRKHTHISREYLIGVSVLEAKGGAESWEIQRLVELANSQDRAYRECRKFLRKLTLPANLPEVPPESRLSLQRSVARFERVFRSLGLDPNLVPRITGIIPPKLAEDAFLLSGLEGLMRLIDGAPRDEQGAVVKTLKRIVYSDPPDFEAFREFMQVTMRFRRGVFSRLNVMNMIHATNTFHASSPLARGPFLELFRMRLGSPFEAFQVEAPLNFARSRLGKGDRVTVEPLTSTGFASFIVESSTGEKSRYIVEGIANTVSGVKDFMKVASRLIEALPDHNPKEEVIPNRIHIEIPSMDPNITPDQLRSWGLNFFLHGGRRVAEALAREAVKSEVEKDPLLKAQPQADRFLLRTLEEQRDYWLATIPKLDQVEITYPEVRRVPRTRDEEIRREIVFRTVVIDRNFQSREKMIATLRETVAQSHQQADVLRLFTLLMEAGRRDNALQVLGSEMQGASDRKKVRQTYRDMVNLSLGSLFPNLTEYYSLFDPKIVGFFSEFFGTTFTLDSLERFFRLAHPDYDIPNIMVNRSGDHQIRLSVPIVTRPGHEDAGQFTFHLTFPEKGPRWVAELSSSRMNESEESNHQRNGVGMFLMECMFRFLQELRVKHLDLEGTDVGRYAWLRMGAEFTDREQQQGVATRLFKFMTTHLYEVREHQLTSSRGITRAMSFLTPEDRRLFISKFFIVDARYRFNLEPGSNSMNVFQTYFMNRAGRLLAGKTPRDPD